MSFNLAKWDKLSSAAVTGLPILWVYASATDALATIGAANYFDDIAYNMSVGDYIYIRGSDGSNLYGVTAVSPHVTISPNPDVVAPGSIVNADINAAAAIDFSKLATLASGNLLVGSAGGVPTSVAMSGDATIVASGALTIANSAVTNAKVSASAAIDFSKLAALASGNILVGSAGNVATSVVMSGDATIVASGALTIANSAITNAKVSASAAIDFSKLHSLTDAHILVGSGANVATDVAVSGDLTLANTGAFTLGAVVNGAKLANSAPADTAAAVPIMYLFAMAGGATASVSIAVGQKITVTDAWVVNKAAGTASDTITVKNNAGTAITDDMDINKSDKVITRAGSIDDAQRVVSAGGNLTVTETDGGGSDSPACDVYVMGYKTA